MIYLTLLLDGQTQKEYVLEKDLITIGRAPESDVVIENLGISAHHATINSTSLTIEDTSANGTYVNNERIKSHVLENGDLIKLGKHEIRFFHSGREQHDLLTPVETTVLASSKTVATDSKR